MTQDHVLLINILPLSLPNQLSSTAAVKLINNNDHNDQQYR
jgi:hypothetical protein